MASPQVQPIHWSEEKYKELESQIEGFWAEDEWDMCRCPLGRGSGRIRFNLPEISTNNEVKYACWQNFVAKKWSFKGKYPVYINRIIKWLLEIHTNIPSILVHQLDRWELSLRSYLVEQGKLSQRTIEQLDSFQKLRYYKQDDRCIYYFRQIYCLVQEHYDDKTEYEKDVCDVRKLGLVCSKSRSNYKLNFTIVTQPWLRQSAKQFIRYSLSNNSVSHCQHAITALNEFSFFLTQCSSQKAASDIDRSLIVKYLEHLSSRGIAATTRAKYISHLRIFLKLCARENWANVPEKELIYNEELPRRSSAQPRYIPQEVLKQLNQHIDALPPQFMRMVLVHQETGRRIDELCSMCFDCLTQDTHGDFFLRYVNSKMKRERSIPLSREVALVILQQQEFIQNEWGKGFPYLFPTPKPWGKGEPMKQDNFNNVLNKLAYEKNICDSTGVIWRFQSHQFRHTVGTRMANLGVPIHIIKTFLDHDLFEMTLRYVAIHNQTLKEEFIRYKDKMVDVSGQVVSYENVAAEMASGSDPNSIDAQWLKKNIRAQALPNGLCALPVNQPECPYGANKCVTGSDGKGCPHFKTDIRYLDKHKDHLRRTNENIAWAQETPESKRSQEILRSNLPVKQNLERIIGSLEDNKPRNSNSEII